MEYLIVGLIGLAFGSFASVLVHRLHTQEDGILGGRSKCPQCFKQLRKRDMVPVLSYLVNKAKCFFCKTPISARYPLLELSMATLFVLTTYLVGTADIPQLGFYLFIAFVFVVLTFYDFLFKEVPDQVSLPAVVISIAYMLTYGQMEWQSLAIGFAVPVVFFGLLYFGSQGRWLGGGDIRIGALMGALLGWPHVLVALFLGYLSGSLYSVVGLLSGKFNRKTQIPFVPFLLLGTFLAMFWGQEMINWYTHYL